MERLMFAHLFHPYCIVANWKEPNHMNLERMNEQLAAYQKKQPEKDTKDQSDQIAYNVWLEHPMTKKVLLGLRKAKESLVQQCSAHAESDEKILRIIAIRLRCLDNLINEIEFGVHNK